MVYNTIEDMFAQIKDADLMFHCWAHPTLLLNSVTHNVETTSLHLQSLQNLTIDALQGRLTISIIRPNRLIELLKQINQNTLPDLFLPYSIPKDIMMYYRDLAVHLTTSDDGIMILLPIPLKSLMSEFHFYEVQHVPVPYKNMSLLLTYDVPHPFIALSTDQTNIVHLTESEYNHCVTNKENLCHFKSPIRFAEQVSNDCSTALILRKSIDKCEVRITPNDLVLPQSHWLANGK